jgi:hypothetical protein
MTILERLSGGNGCFYVKAGDPVTYTFEYFVVNDDCEIENLEINSVDVTNNLGLTENILKSGRIIYAPIAQPFNLIKLKTGSVILY